MHPVLFETGGITVYSYGFLIALGAVLGVAYMAVRGKKEVGLTFDQANALFLTIFIAAFAGGKVFLFLEDPSYYVQRPESLLSGRGFVFYGSFLFAVPAMTWYFRRYELPVYRMLDIMAVTTCMVHMAGRLGCFMAGCCYGLPTDSFAGVVFTDPACQASPLNTPLHPTQLYEAGYILLILLLLLYLRGRKSFHGQLFLCYLASYAAGRFIIEYARGDAVRGFVVDGVLSYAQLAALLIVLVVALLYYRWSQGNRIRSG